MAGGVTGDSFRFERFRLDPGQRTLSRDGAAVDLPARYFDALGLLVREAGRLVSKDRFLDEVWRGVPVTDEALTQCIKTLRRKLGDEAARPRFIETVPKHGYRFIAPVEAGEVTATAPQPALPEAGERAPEGQWRRLLLLAGAGTLGAGVAGVVGGLFYGFVGASQPLGPGMGAASVLLVLLWLTLAAALTGGAGVSLGIAAASLLPDRRWLVVGGAIGGMVVGGVVKLLGLDAFHLLFGKSPGDITGAAEGLALGASVGLGAWLTGRPAPLRRTLAIAGLVGGAAGALIAALGGRLMGGSLDLLARGFAESQLRLDEIGGLFGEAGFGPVSRAVTGALEGALFAACIVGAIALARENLDSAGRIPS